MRKPLRAGFVFLVLSSSAGAQTVKIEHQPVGCAVAERFPRLDALFSPADSVAVARVLFQGATNQEWYSVEMKRGGEGFSGVLPKPKKSLKVFRYYIEVTDKALGTSRTPEYSTAVVGGSGVCQGKIATAVGSASVLVQSPAGLAAVPAGFAPSGVVAGPVAGSSTGAGGAAGAAGVTGAAGAAAATGGGLSGGAVAGIVAGAGAVAAGAAVAAKAGDDGSSSGNTPTPTPTPSTSYSGPFSAQMVIQFSNLAGPGGCQTTTSTHVGTMTMILQSSGGSATATLAGTRTVVANTGNCNGPGNVVGDTTPINWGGVQVTGGSANLAFSVASPGAGSAEAISFSGGLNGNVINGTLTFTHTLTSPFGNQAGSVSVPVTLR